LNCAWVASAETGFGLAADVPIPMSALQECLDLIVSEAGLVLMLITMLVLFTLALLGAIGEFVTDEEDPPGPPRSEKSAKPLTDWIKNSFSPGPPPGRQIGARANGRRLRCAAACPRRHRFGFHLFRSISHINVEVRALRGGSFRNKN
jgi:Na+-transporting methylmalonyl-CoA/oxaloacetate decarboxylase gamma subunit